MPCRLANAQKPGLLHLTELLLSVLLLSITAVDNLKANDVIIDMLHLLLLCNILLYVPCKAGNGNRTRILRLEV